MTSSKKHLTKVVPFKIKNSDSKKSELNDDSFSDTLSELLTDPKLKALQDAIDRGQYFLSSDQVADLFLKKSSANQKSRDADCGKSKKNKASKDANLESTKLRILKKNEG